MGPASGIRIADLEAKTGSEMHSIPPAAILTFLPVFPRTLQFR